MASQRNEMRKFLRGYHRTSVNEAGPGVECQGAAWYGGPHKGHGRDANMHSLDGSMSEDLIDSSRQVHGGPVPTGNMARDPGPHPVAGAAGSRANERSVLPVFDLRDESHGSLQGSAGFRLENTRRRRPMARDWSHVRKRWVAAVACFSTAAIGITIGIYAGMVPSIQYYLVDFHHYAIVGNVAFYFGLAVPTLVCWPLPMLHGRKPYICGTLALSMPLLFVQGVVVSQQRSPYVSFWRWALLGSRGLLGFVLGFASLSSPCVLLDLFGASLMSKNPHQEVVDHHDVRRHGGGMGIWLGIWTWCYIGSLGVGFLVGAVIIQYRAPSWGFYIGILLMAVVLVFNILCPETRRSTYRRSVAEVRTQTGEILRRLVRGEVMAHRLRTGPKWWGQEVYQGILLSLEMLRQPGFAVMAVYYGWLYAQVVLIIVLLGSLTSRFYRMRPSMVGLCVSAIAMGALLASPFQKASVFSRDRYAEQRTNSMTFDDRITWTSHFVRRAVFTICLPLAGILYAVISTGPPTHVAVPSAVAGAIGFLSCLAISECSGLLMETFDCSDLQPEMTSRPHDPTSRNQKPTNYSAYPRVTSGIMVCQGLGFLLAAGATGIGGMAQRNLGQRTATAVVASVLFLLSVLLLATLIRFRTVHIIPTSRTVEMEQWAIAKERQVKRRQTAMLELKMRKARSKTAGVGAGGDAVTTGSASGTSPDDEPFRPLIIGNPSSKTRRMNILELGALTRWTEIRRRNRLIDEAAIAAGQASSLNREAVASAIDHLADKGREALGHLSHGTDSVRDFAARGRHRAQQSEGTSRTRHEAASPQHEGGTE